MATTRQDTALDTATVDADLPADVTASIAEDVENEESGNALIEGADALLRLLEADEATGGHAGVMQLIEWWYSEGPRMQPLAAEPIAAAAVCQALFGKDIVPTIEQDGTGDLCREALQIACVFLRVSRSAQGAFLALALATLGQAEDAKGEKGEK